MSNVYLYDGKQYRGYPSCEGCDGSGIRPDASPHAGPAPEGFTIIERCDTCEKFASDLDAARAWGVDAQEQAGNGTYQTIARAKQ